MNFDDFKAVARIDRKENKVHWEYNRLPCSCIWWHMKEQTDEQVLHGVWWCYYGKRIAEKAKEKAVEHDSVEHTSVERTTKGGRFWQPTITSPDSSTMDFIREKCECDAMCEG